MCLAYFADRAVFGKRCDKNPNLKYFSAEDFALFAEKVCLDGGLNGFLYFKDGNKESERLIIFCHGMGAGQVAYTTEIAYFCNVGTVLAVDNRGCNFSEGKNMKGFYSGAEAAIAAVDYAKKLRYKKIYLVGHSWGGYSALCASYKRKVDGVVAISAPRTPSKTMVDGASPVISRPIAEVLRPFWYILNFFKYGKKGNSNSARCAMKNNTPTLLIHGENDKVVTRKNSAFFNAEGANIQKYLAAGKAHNPYNTEKAEILLAKLSSSLKDGTYEKDKFDFKGATEEDEEVMRRITEFIENN